jgi:metal-responsive CopG/Arc/MetJ family transcriptional regulator
MIAKMHARERGRPPKGDATMEQIAIRLPKTMLAEIDDAIAGRLDGKNRSDIIRELLGEAIQARAKAKGRGARRPD